jgi:hypothetical protein
VTDRPDHILENFRHDRARHRRRIVEASEVSRGFQDSDRFGDIEIEIARPPRNGLVPSPDQEAWHGNPLRQVFVLKPLLELGLAARRDVVEDRENPGRRARFIGSE